MNNSLLQQCLGILKRDDVKEQLKYLVRPIIDTIFQEIYPYIYLSFLFVIVSFLLILGIFILLLRSKISLSKIN